LCADELLVLLQLNQVVLEVGGVRQRGGYAVAHRDELVLRAFLGDVVDLVVELLQVLHVEV